ncbi:MAG: protoporphyrinogen/coproporphyrinogen oxidase [Actinomycetota bacterium]|nr:protoporphyrinogen/coproporphyrinogen oxidase [Actinomycetota bacterium]
MRVCVVGAGIAGLVAAYRLEQQGHEVTLLEASERAGGKIRAGRLDGIEIEDGPDAFLIRDEAPLRLLDDLGLNTTKSPAVFGAYLWHSNALRKLPPGSPYGIPSDPWAARREGLLSTFGAARAWAERFNAAALSGPDVSIGRFVRDRFGDEVVSNLVDPLLAGVRGGSTDEISLAAAARDIDSLARSNKSLLKALRGNAPQAPRFVAPEGGVSRLTEALVARISDLRLSSAVEHIQEGVTVSTGSTQETFDAVALACPPSAAAPIVPDEDVAAGLRKIEHASLAVITLVYPAGAYRVPAGGSGFLVPTHAGLAISGCTWYSTKWPDPRNGGRMIARCVIGRSGMDPNLARSDGDIAAVVHRDLQTTMKVSVPPLAHRVVRWDEAIPQYRVGHLDRLREIEVRLQRVGPIFLIGAGYRGSGIPDCIAQAERAAEIIGSLEPSPRR